MKIAWKVNEGTVIATTPRCPLTTNDVNITDIIIAKNTVEFDQLIGSNDHPVGGVGVVGDDHLVGEARGLQLLHELPMGKCQLWWHCFHPVAFYLIQSCSTFR